MPQLRRNITVYSPEQQPAVEIAGFYQHGSVSISMFHTWLDIILDKDNPDWQLFEADSDGNPVQPPQKIARTDLSPMPLGKVVILSPDGKPFKVKLTAETYRPRTLSADNTGPAATDKFRDRVRERDGQCCVTGARPYGGPDGPFWSGFVASHIFPIAHFDVWTHRDYGRVITDDAPESAQGCAGINSIQNGLLLRSDVQHHFDDYLFAINPDDGYRLIDFGDQNGRDGKVLWRNTAVAPQYWPHDDFLRDHLRQCILANVKGVGRTGSEWFDHEEPFDAANLTVWGEGNPSRFEVEMRTRLGFPREY